MRLECEQLEPRDLRSVIPLMGEPAVLASGERVRLAKDDAGAIYAERYHLDLVPASESGWYRPGLDLRGYSVPQMVIDGDSLAYAGHVTAMNLRDILGVGLALTVQDGSAIDVVLSQDGGVSWPMPHELFDVIQAQSRPSAPAPAEVPAKMVVPFTVSVVLNVGPQITAPNWPAMSPVAVSAAVMDASGTLVAAKAVTPDMLAASIYLIPVPASLQHPGTYISSGEAYYL
jgi:hypothetical protein